MREKVLDKADDRKPVQRADEPAKVETFKLLYRQLARKLHPDMNASDQESDWRKSMWLRVQQAYKIEDKKEMTKLFHLVLLRNSDGNPCASANFKSPRLALRRDQRHQ